MDEVSLNRTHRFGKDIATFSSLLFKEFEATKTCDCCKREYRDQGIFIVRGEDVKFYLKEYPDTKILRWNKSNVSLNEINMRASKGLDFGRVLIYPTEKVVNYLETQDADKYLAGSIKMAFYVALTRARISAAIVCNQELDSFDGLIKIWGKAE